MSSPGEINTQTTLSCWFCVVKASDTRLANLFEVGDAVCKEEMQLTVTTKSRKINECRKRDVSGS